MTRNEKVEYISNKTGMGFNNSYRLLSLFGCNLEDTMNFLEKYRQVNCVDNMGLAKLVFEQQEEIKDLKRRIEQLEEEVVLKELIHK